MMIRMMPPTLMPMFMGPSSGNRFVSGYPV